MSRENVNDLYLFLAVAEERSFTKAAARLGMSQSALSHAVRTLEARLGVRLLSRTTRSVSPTDAGERLVKNVGPRLAEIGAELAAVSDLGDKPAGTIRITAIDHVVDRRDPNRSGRLVAEVTDGGEFGVDLRQPRRDVLEQAFAGVGGRDAARGAAQQSHAQPGLQRAHRMAER